MYQKKRKIMILGCLIIIFFLPGFLAIWFYQHPIQFKNTLNHGKLLSPPIRIPNLKSKNWQWIIWCPKKSALICAVTLDKLSRIRLALGRRWYDVTVNIVYPENQRIRGVSLATSKPAIWLMDKRGFVVMTYAVSAASQDIFSDIKTLLASD